MTRVIYILAATVMICTGCSSTNVFVQNSHAIRGQRIGMANIDISIKRKPGQSSSGDTLCPCIAQSAKDVLIPYLQQAGFTVINLSLDNVSGFSQIKAAADSLKIDYVFKGSGMVQVTGSSFFLHSFTGRLIDLKTMETPVSVSFTAGGVTVIKAAGKIGKAIAKKIR